MEERMRRKRGRIRKERRGRGGVWMRGGGEAVEDGRGRGEGYRIGKRG